MTGFRPSLGRRHFLASTIVGSVGLLLPLSPPIRPRRRPRCPGLVRSLHQRQQLRRRRRRSIGYRRRRDVRDRGRYLDPARSNIGRPTRSSPTSSGASRRPDGRIARPSTTTRRACSSRRCRSSPTIGRTSTTGAAPKRRSSRYPNFVTNIDGLDIHFIHVKSKHPNALPVIVTHGWPGSIIEQLKIIGPLTDPTAHGGTAADAFDVVIPSLPGYGFSGKPTAPGWDVPRIARAWDMLMKRLGYTRYVAQGGDWGNAISEVMALQQPPGLLAIHTNMSATLARSDPQGASRRPAAGRSLARRAARLGPARPTSTSTGSAMRTR